jgi:hypothetical protein
VSHLRRGPAASGGADHLVVVQEGAVQDQAVRGGGDRPERVVDRG